MCSISVENIGKKFQKEWIFRKITMQLSSTYSYAIVGGNGSGKSTLLQLLAGYISPTEGKIAYEVLNKSVLVEDIYAHLSFVSPYTELIEEFTLKEMVQFHQKFKSFRDNISCEALISLMYLDKSGNKPIRYFSSGMKQRLKLGLALWSDTPFLFLDEPCSNLDKQGVDWYRFHIEGNVKNRLCVISSNQSYEYDFVHRIIDVQQFK